MSKHILSLAAALAALVSFQSVTAATSADSTRELKWAELMPPAETMSPLKPKTFFSGSTAPTPDGPPPPPLTEGKFMSVKRRQPGSDNPPRVVNELNGQRVRIGGYVVPLDFESTSIKEFLLVPFVGACIHVPPPPANQIVYVKASKAFELSNTFDPVTVTGVMKTEPAFTGLADAGYTIDADSVERRTQ